MQTCALCSPLTNTLCFSLLTSQTVATAFGCLPELEGKTLLLKTTGFSHQIWKNQAAADLEVSPQWLALTVSQVLCKPFGKNIYQQSYSSVQCSTYSSSKRLLFTADRGYYKDLQLIKIQVIPTTPNGKFVTQPLHPRLRGSFSSWMSSLLGCSCPSGKPYTRVHKGNTNWIQII